MNKWKAYGSVSDLVKQFENTQSPSNVDLKKSQSLENIKKSQNFKVVYHKFENKDPDTTESPLRKHPSTNHLECLQLQEINQIRKKIYVISGKLNERPDNTSYSFYLQELSQLILDVGNVVDYGYAAIKSEKALILSLLHRFYMHVRDKLNNQNCTFEEDESVKGLVAKSESVDRKSTPTPTIRMKMTSSDVAKGVGYSGINEKQGNETKKTPQRKYDKNPANTQHSNQEPPKNVSNISRKISRLQCSIDQEPELRPKNRFFSPQTTAGNNQNKRNTWDSTPTVYNVNNKFEHPREKHEEKNDQNKWGNLSNSSSFRSFYSAKSVDRANNIEKPIDNFPNGGRSKALHQPASYDGRSDGAHRWDNISNSSGSGQNRSSWNSFASSQDIHGNQDKYETESDTGSIISGNDMFEQKYSGIAERINKVLKKRISLLEEDGLVN